MDGRCTSCKYWTHRDSLPEPYAQCERIPVIDSWKTPTSSAAVSTDSYANLATRSDFGCTEWIHKDSPE